MKAPVLLVDDDEDVREAIQMLLESEGIPVVVAEDGMQALERMRGGLQPSVVLLDLMMPTMAGGDFSEAMRRNERTATVPIVVVTGDVHGTEMAQQLHADACLRKPVEAADLLDTVRRFEKRTA